MNSPDRPDFQALFESAPGLYLVLAPDFRIVAVSDAYLSATMTRREEILGRGLFEVFPDNPDDTEATGVANLRASLDRVLKHRAPDAMAVQKYDIRRPEAEGRMFEERYWSPVNSPVLDDQGGVAYIIHRVEDVTEFVRLKQEGTEQQRLTEQFRSRVGRMETEVYQRAQEIQEANRKLREFQAELEARVEARTADLKLANEDLEREMAERLRTEETLRKTEAQFRQAEKMEAIGRLAGGVAHDFNNLLTVIMGFSQLLKLRLRPEEPPYRDADEIAKAAARAASLTRQLLAFSRRQVLELQVLDLNTIVLDLDKMLRRLIGTNIELLTAPAENLWPIHADPGQIEQVLMNLVVNARDAMAKGGTLTIETANAELDEVYTSTRPGVLPGSYTMVAVSDSGCGMEPETMAHIFEPFFTTKNPGEGTGLGLSTVHGIVKQSGGHIEVYSERGQGTTFKIYLPRTHEAAQSSSAAKPVLTMPRGSETVLLVDDEEVVRAVMRRPLEQHGYTVLEASGSIDALERFGELEVSPDILVTDVVMPGLSGPELAARLSVIYPGSRVLFTSGFPGNAMFHQGMIEREIAFLQKPFTPEALLRRVREVLDAPSAAAA